MSKTYSHIFMLPRACAAGAENKLRQPRGRRVSFWLRQWLALCSLALLASPNLFTIANLARVWAQCDVYEDGLTRLCRLHQPVIQTAEAKKQPAVCKEAPRTAELRFS
jgi:hypothetical protein